MERATIAIDRQLTIARHYSNKYHIREETRSLDHITAKMTGELLARLPTIILAADPVYVSPKIVEQLDAANDTLPQPPTLYRDHIFTRHGFAVWGDTEFSLYWLLADSLGRGWISTGDTDRGVLLTVFCDEIYLFTVAIPVDKPIDTFSTVYSSIIDEDIRFDHGMEEEKYSALSASFIENLISLLTFASQRVASVTDQRAERATRKRYQREHKTEPPPIRVISFRRRDHTVAAQPGQSGRHVSVRFIRRGHWRNQWYPSKQRHEPVWIEQTIVGPEDAPVKGKVNLFKVER